MRAKHVTSLAGGIVILAGGAFAFTQWRAAREAAILSCIMSVHQGIANLNLSGKDFPDVGPEWAVLNESEGNKIILAASKIRPPDCAGVKSGGPYLDYWGRPLQIGARRSPDGKLEFRVWSKGRDGESGTSDDLISPFGEKAITSK